MLEFLKSRRKVLSSIDMLGNLQYFKSEKEEVVQNMNYLEYSINRTLFYSPITHHFPRDSISSIPSSQERTKKKRTMIKAIGSTFDGMAHVTSRVG